MILNFSPHQPHGIQVRRKPVQLSLTASYVFEFGLFERPLRHSATQTILFQDYIEEPIGGTAVGEFWIVAVEIFGAGSFKPACSST